MEILSIPPPTPRGLGHRDGGVDVRIFPLFLGRSGVGTSGWWGEWKGFSFVSRAFVRFGGETAVPAVPEIPGLGGGSASIQRC